MLVCWHGGYISAQMVFTAISQWNYAAKISSSPFDSALPGWSIELENSRIDFLSKSQRNLPHPSWTIWREKLASRPSLWLGKNSLGGSIHHCMTEGRESRIHNMGLYSISWPAIVHPGCLVFSWQVFDRPAAVLPPSLQSVYCYLAWLHQDAAHMGHLLVERWRRGNLETSLQRSF